MMTVRAEQAASHALRATSLPVPTNFSTGRASDRPDHCNLFPNFNQQKVQG
jgi:hypothetical protein